MTENNSNRYIVRIDQTYNRTHGWWVRLHWYGKCHHEWFPDLHNGGKFSALLAAVAWRNAKCKEIGKPLTWRTVVTSNPRNKTGVIGIKEHKDCYEITWALSTNKVSRTSISKRKHGKEKAFLIAKKIRRGKEEKIYGCNYQ